MEIRVPQLAEGVNSGTVVSVLVSEGDEVQKEQTILELETEKAVAPIPATEGGKIDKILVKEGDSVSVGQVIVQLAGGGGKSVSAPAPKAAAPTPAPEPKVAPVQTKVPTTPIPQPPEGGYQYTSSTGAPPPASPSIRKLARELGIDLTRVPGTANGGRITLDDLKNYIQSLQQGTAAPAASSASAAKAAPVNVDFSKWGSVQKKPMSLLRKKIAEKMLESWTTIPHVTQYDEADITGLLALRKKYLADYEKAGVRLTVTTFVYKAIVEVLKKFPEFNASINDATEEIVYKDYYHLGLAVDTEQGLIVPVIRDVDKKDLVELSKDITDLATRTRDRKISLEEMQGGTFTISNQGGIGGDHFTPIINKPEVAILGVGQASKKPIVVDNKPEIRMMMPLALSYDHRLIDGGKAARFITEFVNLLENFDEGQVKLSKKGS